MSHGYASRDGVWFVQDDNFRIGGNGKPDFKRSLLGIGQHARRRIFARVKIDLFHDLIATRSNCVEFRHAVPKCISMPHLPENAAANILKNTQAGKYIRDLKTSR